MSDRRRETAASAGWTLIELLILIAILGILATILVPYFLGVLEKFKINRAIVDMKLIETDISIYEDQHDALPTSLDDLPPGHRIDPWGHPYVYFLFTGHGWRGSARKDRFLVPINSRFDLYSVGRDGKTRPPLQHPLSLDDVVRANDGQFYGLGKSF